MILYTHAHIHINVPQKINAKKDEKEVDNTKHLRYTTRRQ
jgi:hypothetical protein